MYYFIILLPLFSTHLHPLENRISSLKTRSKNIATKERSVTTNALFLMMTKLFSGFYQAM